MSYRVYYLNDQIFDGVDGKAPLHNVLMILQQHPMDTSVWATMHGADYYVWKWNQWIGMRENGFIMELKEQDLLRPCVGTQHEVYSNDVWRTVDYVGFVEWIEQDKLALIGAMADDKVFNDLMKKVHADKQYAEEHGELPE